MNSCIRMNRRKLLLCIFAQMKKTGLLCLLIIGYLISCQSDVQETNGNKEKAVARVFEKKLFLSEIKSLLPKNTNAKDSAIFIQSYIQQWITDELILRQAENNLSEDEKNLQKELDEYRKNLLVYRYESELVHQ